jgi:uncharacterized repeat protein (TIGR02543 family)
MPSVTGVTVGPPTVSVAKGITQTFTATVSGNKLEETHKTVNWTVTGGTKAATAIAANGLLTIADDETATSLTVKATSTVDNTKSGTATVTVTEKSPYADYFGTWRNRDEEWQQATISADRIVYSTIGGFGFTIEGLTWTETNNQGDLIADYPKGYRITGTMKRNNGFGTLIPKADGSGSASAGDIALISFYINTDKESIMMGNFATAEQEAFYGPYDIKTDAAYWQITWNLDGGAWPTNANHATQVAKDGKIASPAAPTKTDLLFEGWYSNASLTSSSKVTFPYDVNSATGNITLYAKWEAPATLRITKTPIYMYSTITLQRRTESGAWVNAYLVPTGAGTSNMSVQPGTYAIYLTHWSCATVNCMSSTTSSSFTVSSGQTRNISIVGNAISFP